MVLALVCALIAFALGFVVGRWFAGEATVERPGATAPAPVVATLDDEAFMARLAVELGAGRKIEAIKLYRERTGVGLKEAKDAVEALERGG
jgi:ribosomal protein L7/L12